MKTIERLGTMIDCSRDGVYTVDTLKRMFSLLGQMGYNYVQLYTEDVYELDEEPYFGYLRGRYTKSEMKELDASARENGLELVPCIQTLAHLPGVTRWKQYQKCTDTGDILLAGEESTYALIEKMFAFCAECFTSRRINIGMDEAHMVGLGQYLAKNGYEDRFRILLKHLGRVAGIAEKYGFSPMMWSDMFFRLANNGTYYCQNDNVPQEVKALIPKDMSLIYWDYYNTDKAHFDGMLRAHQKFDRPVVFAGGAWSWSGFVPGNRFSIRSNEAAIRACLDAGVEDVFITCWKDDGAECSLFSSLPALFSAAQFARGNFDMADIAASFQKFTGVEWETFLALDDVDAKGETLKNPSKYMLYSDPFFGFFDKTVKEETDALLAVREKLCAGAKSVRYGYIFKTLIALCDVLEIKTTLGLRTRRAYKSGDRAAVFDVIADYARLEKLLQVFYRRFCTQWDRECKQNGSENHDVRIGGLILRIRHCRAILEEYAAGKRADIPALEEEILPFADAEEGESVLYNDWMNTAFVHPRM